MALKSFMRKVVMRIASRLSVRGAVVLAKSGVIGALTRFTALFTSGAWAYIGIGYYVVYENRAAFATGNPFVVLEALARSIGSGDAAIIQGISLVKSATGVADATLYIGFATILGGAATILWLYKGFAAVARFRDADISMESILFYFVLFAVPLSLWANGQPPFIGFVELVSASPEIMESVSRVGGLDLSLEAVNGSAGK